MHVMALWRGCRRYRPDLPGDRRPAQIHRFAWPDARDTVRVAGEFTRDEKLTWVEAALFAAEEPLTATRLAQVAGLVDAGEARRQAARLRELLLREGSSFELVEVAGGYQLLTCSEFHPWLARLKQTVGDLRLSPAARETLAIVAYRQPIARADLEGIRGVQSGEVLAQLMDKGLLRIAGRDDSLGRPLLYGTTKKFLQLYGLTNLRDLPAAEGIESKQRRGSDSDES